jgi:hypothetical protein
MRLPGGNLTSIMEAIQATHHTQAMIHGLGGRLRCLVQLMADIVEQSRLGDFRQR